MVDKVEDREGTSMCLWFTHDSVAVAPEGETDGRSHSKGVTLTSKRQDELPTLYDHVNSGARGRPRIYILPGSLRCFHLLAYM